MRIWELTPSDFHGNLAPNPGSDIEWSALVGILPNLSNEAPHPLPHTQGFEYRIASRSSTADADIVVYEIVTGQAVAAKLGPTITTDPVFRGRRIGPGMIVALYDHYPWPQGSNFQVSTLGAQAFRRAHALEVSAAFSRGDPVPRSNLDHYDLL